MHYHPPVASMNSTEKARTIMRERRHGQLRASLPVALQDPVEVVRDVLEDQLELGRARDLKVLELHDVGVSEIPQQRTLADDGRGHAVALALIDVDPLERHPLVCVAVLRQEDGAEDPAADEVQRLVPRRDGRNVRRLADHSGVGACCAPRAHRVWIVARVLSIMSWASQRYHTATLSRGGRRIEGPLFHP